MRFTNERVLGFVAVLTCVAGVAWVCLPGAKATENTANDAAVERARKEVKMLDDLYKTAVVLMNDTWVKTESDTAAGTVARQLFGAMKEKGWHDARLIDGTGNPFNEENAPGDAFEKAAMEKIKAGETYVEAIEGTGDKRTLRAATLVPAVNKGCIMCHAGHEVGDVLGAISYKLPIE